MRIWLDCTSLRDWKYDHLSGIQRTILGIHKGWKDLGLTPLLFHYEHEHDCFVETPLNELPKLVRMALGGQDSVLGEKSQTQGAYDLEEKISSCDILAKESRQSEGSDLLTTLLGNSHNAKQLRNAIAAHNLTRWQLTKALRSYFQKNGSKSEIPDQSKPIHPQKEQGIKENDLIRMIGKGDYMFSFGSECFERPNDLLAYKRLQAQGASIVRMIYDLIPTSQPQWVNKNQTETFEKSLMQLLTDSDYLLTISEFSRQQILEYASEKEIELPSIKVVRLGDSVVSSPGEQFTFPSTTSRPKRQFLLSIGTLEPRKNHQLLLCAWRIMATADKDKCPDLVCIGYPHPQTGQIRHEMAHDPLLKDHIYLPGNIGDGQVEWYFEHCVATIFPSLCEGWGLPVAESLARGKLCLAADVTSIPEISELTILFNPYDPVTLANVVGRVCQDQVWREDVETRIRNNYQITEWQMTAQQCLDAVVEG